MNSKVTTVPAHAGDSKQSIYFDTVQNSEAEKPTNSGAQVISFPKVHTVPKEIHIGKETNKTPLRKQYPSEYSSWHNRKYTARKRGWVWHPDFDKFANFLKIMGPKPDSSYTLDRKDSANPEYSPENCRWASKSLQSANRRGRHLVSCWGIERSITEWSRHTKDISAGTIRARLKRGWAPEQALTTPPRWAQKTDSGDSVQSIAGGWGKQIQKVWAREMREQSDVGMYVFSKLDYACIAQMARIFNVDWYLQDEGLEAIELVLRQWGAFCIFAQKQNAISDRKIPRRPTTPFMLEYIFDVKEYFAKDKRYKRWELESKSKPKPEKKKPENCGYIDNLGNVVFDGVGL